ncbi:dihydrolipoamide acetyltransferase family protein [Pseudonocardia hispaniensis]|uniref:Dihydrolipoamide acetyltransferase component of pyruvate dehydrogenase complex n=1 Tax=Pseudonocardia hispaniensis TaxID=904933 RepID=A0ABW1J4U2_9PSEU
MGRIMTQRIFTLPDLGEGLPDAELVRWLVQVGDTIAVDAPVAEVETAKAIVEVPAPFAGRVAELHGTPGTTITVGAPLLTVAEPHDAAIAAGVAAYVEEERAGSGNVLIGYGTSADLPAGTGRRHRRRRPAPDPAAAGDGTAPAGRARVRSPLVRRLATQRGIDLSTLTGSGPEGLITRTDVERAAALHAPASQPTPTRIEPSDETGRDRRTGLAIRERVPLHGLRKAITRTLTRSRREIPDATTWVDVDATALLELRAALSSPERRGPGLLALLARFVVAGLAHFPELNARVDADAEQILHLDGINLGIAAQTDRGLLVPAVRDAHLLSTRRLDAEIRRLTAAARDGAATPDELSQGSFTLNNYGVLGVDGSAAIINHPEVAILGIGRIHPRPWVIDGQVVPRFITQLSLVFDHRVCDGGAAAGFLRFVADAIESPLAALADL